LRRLAVVIAAKASQGRGFRIVTQCTNKGVEGLRQVSDVRDFAATMREE
jgi:hypothetical protein